MTQVVKKRFVEEVNNVMGNVFAHGTLADGIAIEVDMLGAPLPATVTLKSSAAARLIEASSDDGEEFWTPAVDVASPTMQVLYVTMPISHLRITGEAGDTWSIR